MFKPRAKAVISIFNTGGVSQMETFDYKPAMEKYAGQVLGGDVRVHDGRPGPIMPGIFKFRSMDNAERMFRRSFRTSARK